MASGCLEQRHIVLGASLRHYRYAFLRGPAGSRWVSRWREAPRGGNDVRGKGRLVYWNSTNLPSGEV
jgi:hypothetical protein